MRRRPPTKQSGHKTGPQRIDGLTLGVREAAALIGVSEKTVRAQIARGQIPYRHRHRRIYFVRAELEDWLVAAPGVTVKQAVANAAARERGPR